MTNYVNSTYYVKKQLRKRQQAVRLLLHSYKPHSKQEALLHREFSSIYAELDHSQSVGNKAAMIREGSRSAKFHTEIDGRRDPALYFANVIKARRVRGRNSASTIIRTTIINMTSSKSHSWLSIYRSRRGKQISISVFSSTVRTSYVLF